MYLRFSVPRNCTFNKLKFVKFTQNLILFVDICWLSYNLKFLLFFYAHLNQQYTNQFSFCIYYLNNTVSKIPGHLQCFVCVLSRERVYYQLFFSIKVNLIFWWFVIEIFNRAMKVDSAEPNHLYRPIEPL